MKKNFNGFTLIELLVAVSIVAVLSFIAIVIFSDIQKNSRDAKRKGDIDAIAAALESHYTVGSSTPYPAVTDSLFSSGVAPEPPGGTVDGSGVEETDYIYISKADGRTWVSKTVAGNAFQICAHLEKPTGNASTVTGTYVNTNDGAYYCRSSQM